MELNHKLMVQEIERRTKPTLKKMYRVNFDREKGFFAHYVIDIEASNRDEARKIAESMWNEHFSGKNVPHMFHIHVRKLKDTEEFLYHYFKRGEYYKEL